MVIQSVVWALFAMDKPKPNIWAHHDYKIRYYVVD